MYVRAAATPPDAFLAPATSQFIIFRHPGYDDTRNILLRLYALDASSFSSSHSSSGFGLHAGYALAACGVVAGNRWDGWLSEHRHRHGDGLPRITFCAADRDKMLDKHEYYFHLPDVDDDENNDLSPYPIVPTFREWCFPHNQLPPTWTQSAPLRNPQQPQVYSVSALTMALRQRDVSCRITGCRESVQTAHVCPQGEEDWYQRNVMSRYNFGNSTSVNNPANAFLLRADLHIAFDKAGFVFVPKPTDGESQQFVLHLLEPSGEYEHLYHNRAMQSMEVSVELLFARFAWTIFPLLAGFLTSKIPRRLQLSTAINEASGEEMAPFFASVEQCDDLAKIPKSRNASPKKRGRPEDSVAESDTSSLGKVDHQRRRKNRRFPKSQQDLMVNEAIEATSIGAPTSNEPSPTTPTSFHKVASLRQEWLNRERLRSDPDHLWEEELAWAADVYNGNITLGEANAKRWVEFNGGEVDDHELTEKGSAE